MRTIRSFIAVNIGLNAVRAIANEQAGLRRRVGERGVDVRWIAPQNLHVTLRFLGQVTEPMVAAIQDGLEPVVKTIAPFEVTAGGLGVFPDERDPRVVWVGMRDEGAVLGRLHAGTSEVLARMGFNLDDKPFRSHVTIGRVKGGDGAALAACLAEAGERAYGAFTVREIVCNRSDLHASGADYHMLWRLPLGGRVRGARPEEAEPTFERDIQDEPPFPDAADEAPDEGETKE
jgi:RNA 2',3'-cyclic 3'-phosphodiesterase